MGKGGSTFCCRPLITHQQGQTGLSYGGHSPFILPLTGSTGFAISFSIPFS
jgi:hypothetical protein